MVKIQIKLNENSNTHILTTPSGYSITKEEFVEVEDSDTYIQNYLLNRDDIIMKEIKIDEGTVKETLIDEVIEDDKIFSE